jgi:hypothetical protein
MRSRQSVAELVAKAQAFLSESELLRAMFEVGFFRPNTVKTEFGLDHSNKKAPACWARAEVPR